MPKRSGLMNLEGMINITGCIKLKNSKLNIPTLFYYHNQKWARSVLLASQVRVPNTDTVLSSLLFTMNYTSSSKHQY